MGKKRFGETKGERTPGTTGSHTRVLSIDLYRGFALVFMVLVHFGIFYGNEDTAHSFAIFFFDHILADWGVADHPIISQYLPGMYIEPEVAYHPAIVKGLFLSGYFPVFPWIAFIIIGFVMGRRIVAQKMRHDLPIFLVTGVVLSCLGDPPKNRTLEIVLFTRDIKFSAN